jgi:hypothetical protein
VTGARFFAATLLFAACADPVGDAPAGVFFPTVPIGADYPAALFEGDLEIDEGCLYLTDHGERWLALWPEGYRAERDEGLIRVLDRAGEVVGVDGGSIRVGGGEGRPVEIGSVEAADHWAEGLTGGDIPERCGHLYWIVSP